MSAAATKSCIACAEDIKAEAMLCKHCNTRQDEKRFQRPNRNRNQELSIQAKALGTWLLRKDQGLISTTFRNLGVLFLGTYIVTKFVVEFMIYSQFTEEGRNPGAVIFSDDIFFIYILFIVLTAVALSYSRMNTALVAATASVIVYLYDIVHSFSIYRFDWTRDPLYLVGQLQSEGFSSQYVVSDVLFWVSQFLFPLALSLLLFGFLKGKKFSQLRNPRRT